MPPHSIAVDSSAAELPRQFLRQAQADLSAGATLDPAQRYLLAHRAALRGAAAVLAHRVVGAASVPSGASVSVWSLIGRVAPALGEWASYFADLGVRRQAVADGSLRVAPREADDLVRAAESFLLVVAGQEMGFPADAG